MCEGIVQQILPALFIYVQSKAGYLLLVLLVVVKLLVVMCPHLKLLELVMYKLKLMVALLERLTLFSINFICM
jgi:hypothetical protein